MRRGDHDPATDPCAGFTLIEMLVSLAVLTVAMTIMAVLLVENSRLNKRQQLEIEAQSSARTTLSLVSQVLRTAGWDPSGAGIGVVTLDSDSTDGIETLDIFADLNGDGDVADLGESVRIRQIQDRVEWRRRTTDPFEIVGVHVTNDADGDGTKELMFTPDSTVNPTRIRLQITAGADAGVNSEPIRYTVTSDITLRNAG